MPNQFVGHIDRWLLLSESEVDYPLLFVRAWIPFNAWYCNNYQITKDRECIDNIKSDANQFRARLVALLNGTYDEAIVFKQHLEHLHNLLEMYPIPESDPNKRLSFNNLYFRRNSLASTTPPLTKNNFQYKAEIATNNSVMVIILNKRSTPPSTVYSYSHTKYDRQHFIADLALNSIRNNHLTNILNCYDEINPKLKESIIARDKKTAIKCNKIFFVNDSHIVSQAIIEILYELRCKLFHGEIQPSKDNFSVYEPCYHILRILLKSLK